MAWRPSTRAAASPARSSRPWTALSRSMRAPATCSWTTSAPGRPASRAARKGPGRHAARRRAGRDRPRQGAEAALQGDPASRRRGLRVRGAQALGAAEVDGRAGRESACRSSHRRQGPGGAGRDRPAALVARAREARSRHAPCDPHHSTWTRSPPTTAPQAFDLADALVAGDLEATSRWPSSSSRTGASRAATVPWLRRLRESTARRRCSTPARRRRRSAGSRRRPGRQEDDPLRAQGRSWTAPRAGLCRGLRTSRSRCAEAPTAARRGFPVLALRWPAAS